MTETNMVIEHFNSDCKDKVYEIFYKKGRMLPEGLVFIDSWLAKDGNRCFQLMEADDISLFKGWTSKWDDLTQFETIEIGEKPTKPGN